MAKAKALDFRARKALILFLGILGTFIMLMP